MRTQQKENGRFYAEKTGNQVFWQECLRALICGNRRGFDGQTSAARLEVVC